MLQSPQPLPPEVVLTTLFNEIADSSASFILVLDDYHVIQAMPVHKMLDFLVEHLPVQMRLVIIMREDPPLPLARLKAGPYIMALLSAYEETSQTVLPQPLVEPLSERELEVLRLLEQGMSNGEIAQKLVISLGTVKTHVHNIIEKLGVQRRAQAAARARELELI